MKTSNAVTHGNVCTMCFLSLELIQIKNYEFVMNAGILGLVVIQHFGSNLSMEIQAFYLKSQIYFTQAFQLLVNFRWRCLTCGVCPNVNLTHLFGVSPLTNGRFGLNTTYEGTTTEKPTMVFHPSSNQHSAIPSSFQI